MRPPSNLGMIGLAAVGWVAAVVFVIALLALIGQ